MVISKINQDTRENWTKELADLFVLWSRMREMRHLSLYKRAVNKESTLIVVVKKKETLI